MHWLEFWKCVQEYANQRVAERHEKIGGLIAQCPNCRRHAHEMNGLRWEWVEGIGHLYCGGCDYVSHWKGDWLEAKTLVGGYLPADSQMPPETQKKPATLSGQQARVLNFKGESK